MLAACGECGKPLAEAPAKVQIFGTLWVPDVASLHCWGCGWGELAPEGRAKVDRAIATIRALGLTSRHRAGPNRIEFRDATNGEVVQIALHTVGSGP